MRTTFDAAYYDRFYRNPDTRAADRGTSRRRAAFICAYLKHLEVPVRRILDLGCGLGHTLTDLGAAFPGARTVGVEHSAYLCRKYGWVQADAASYEASRPFDLVVCNDVVGYLDDAAASRALVNLARLSRAALFFGVLTTEDQDDVADRARTDPRQFVRPAAWYRQRLHRRFANLGGGLYLKKPLEHAVWHLDRL